MSAAEPIGGYLLACDDIDLNAGRPRTVIRVANHGDRPIQVGSHYHFFEVNRWLRFDRASGYGKRLDIPAGTAVRFEPGESREVTLVPFAGRRVWTGGHGFGDGSLDAPGAEDLALVSMKAAGFWTEDPRNG